MPNVSNSIKCPEKSGPLQPIFGGSSSRLCSLNNWFKKWPYKATARLTSVCLHIVAHIKLFTHHLKNMLSSTMARTYVPKGKDAQRPIHIHEGSTNFNQLINQSLHCHQPLLFVSLSFRCLLSKVFPWLLLAHFLRTSSPKKWENYSKQRIHENRPFRNS